jgi:hypothetical protein
LITPLQAASRLRLSTLLLLIVIMALGFGLIVQQRKEARLQAALALYRNQAAETILETLEQPIVLAYSNGMTLEDVLKQVKAVTRRPKLPSGVPIYIDPVGLQEAERTLSVPIKTAPPEGELSLREQLRRLLKPLGLAFSVQQGCLMITSEESLDADDEDPYLKYRDVLK